MKHDHASSFFTALSYGTRKKTPRSLAEKVNETIRSGLCLRERIGDALCLNYKQGLLLVAYPTVFLHLGIFLGRWKVYQRRKGKKDS